MINLYHKWPRLELTVDTAQRIDELLAEVARGGYAAPASQQGSGSPSSPSTRNPMNDAEQQQPQQLEMAPMSYARTLRADQKERDAEAKAARAARIASGEEAPARAEGKDEDDEDEDGKEEEEVLPFSEESRIFRSVDRIKLMHMIITFHGLGGCGLDPKALEEDGCILAYFPLHDMVELRSLEANWLTVLSFPWNQPIDQIKNYLGEKIALYFLWLGLYDSWLSVAAVLGFCFWITIANNGKQSVRDNKLNTFFAPVSTPALNTFFLGS